MSGAASPSIATVPAAILAGGLATRLRPITEKIPKALVEVAGRPFIDHQVALLQFNGIRKLVLCLGYLGEMVRDHLHDGAHLGVHVDYSFDGPKLLGTGGAIKLAGDRGLLGDVFWIMYGDSYMDIDYPAILTHFLARPDALGLMTILHNQNQWDTSNVIFRNGAMLRYDKKIRSPDMHHVDYGVALLRSEALQRIPAGEPFDLATLYTQLVDERRMVGYEVTNRFYEMGSPAGLDETRAYLEKHGKLQSN